MVADLHAHAPALPSRERLASGLRAARAVKAGRQQPCRAGPPDAGRPQQHGQEHSEAAVGRREALARTAAALVAAWALPLAQARAAEGPAEVLEDLRRPTVQTEETQPAAPRQSEEFRTLEDVTLAYRFSYPVTSQGTKLPLIFSRKPERYSSAAPLSADARQRIVAELVDFLHNITVSVTVGPPAGLLKGRQPEEWAAKDVAETVLIDRSTARVSTGQRVSLHSVEFVEKETRGGQPYFVYEHLSQGSPNASNPDLETFRHAWAVSTARPGLDGTPFIYTLNIACPDTDWGRLGPLFKEAQQSFELVAPGKGYVPPDKEPWRFF